MAGVKQRVASMESSLEKLDKREKNYTAELNAALEQYAELQHQATNIDIMELDAARQAIRPDKEHKVMQQLQSTYGKRFDPGMLAQGRKDVVHMLDEALEPVSIRQKLNQLQGLQNKQSHGKEHGQER